LKQAEELNEPLLELLTNHNLVMILGPGGVGKTTVSACLGVKAAAMGKDVRLLTIDPAKRLADALGIGRDVSEQNLGVPHASGTLTASTLDRNEALDRLISRKAGNDKEIRTIVNNRFYKHLSGTLAGVHEYVAIEEVEHLCEAGEQDLLIVDTPPSTEALSFLDAPRKLEAVLNEPVFKTAVNLYSTAGRFSLFGMKAAGMAFRAFSTLLGSAFLRELMEFLAAFKQMFKGFEETASLSAKRFGAPDTTIVLVTGPGPTGVEETWHLAGELQNRGLNLAMVIVNRLMPRFLEPCPDKDLRQELSSLFEQHTIGSTALTRLSKALSENQALLSSIAVTQRDTLKNLVEKLSCPVISLPETRDPNGSIGALYRLVQSAEEVVK